MSRCYHCGVLENEHNGKDHAFRPDGLFGLWRKPRNLYYASRAQAAYAAAEAADDPRDKAAFRAAAKTWEQLAKPLTGTTYSMEPHRLQLAALKRDAAEPLAAYDATATNTEQHGAQVDALGGRERLRAAIIGKKPVTIEF